MRQTLSASFSVPMSLIVVLILHVTDADGSAALGSMSTIVFGVVLLLFPANIILVLRLGYLNTVDSLKAIRELYRKNKLLFTRVSIVKDVVLVAVKLF